MIFFLVVLDNAVRIRDRIQVVYKESACDGAKSNVAKWNLIDRIQFKHVKNCLIGYVLIGLWTLFSWYGMQCKLFGACVVRKRAEEHVLTKK